MKIVAVLLLCAGLIAVAEPRRSHHVAAQMMRDMRDLLTSHHDMYSDPDFDFQHGIDRDERHEDNDDDEADDLDLEEIEEENATPLTTAAAPTPLPPATEAPATEAPATKAPATSGTVCAPKAHIVSCHSIEKHCLTNKITQMHPMMKSLCMEFTKQCMSFCNKLFASCTLHAAKAEKPDYESCYKRFVACVY